MLSPDGRWVACVSNESGNPAVYLRLFPGPGGRTTVSSGPATEPAWAPDGRTVYYRSQVDSLVAASVDLAGPVPRVTARANLFSTANYVRDDVDRAHTVHPDGERFVFVRQQPVATLVVVTDWFGEVKKIFGIEDRGALECSAPVPCRHAGPLPAPTRPTPLIRPPRDPIFGRRKNGFWISCP